MRNQTISCSFVQVLENSTQHSVGLVPNQYLLKFISSATRKSFLYDLVCAQTLVSWRYCLAFCEFLKHVDMHKISNPVFFNIVGSQRSDLVAVYIEGYLMARKNA